MFREEKREEKCEEKFEEKCEEKMDNPPPYNEITKSKKPKAIDTDTVNNLRALKLKEIDEKYYKYLNEKIESINKCIIDIAIPNNYRLINDTIIYDKIDYFSFKKYLDIDSYFFFEEYYDRLYKDILEEYKQFKPEIYKDKTSDLNLPKYKCHQKIGFTLWEKK